MRRSWLHAPGRPGSGQLQPYGAQGDLRAGAFWRRALRGRHTLVIALGVSILLHGAVLLLLAGQRQRRMEIFAIALYAGSGSGAAVGGTEGGTSSGGSAGGGVESRKTGDLQIPRAAPISSSKPVPASGRPSETATRNSGRAPRPARTLAATSESERAESQQTSKAAAKRVAPKAMAMRTTPRKSGQSVDTASGRTAAPETGVAPNPVDGQAGPGYGVGSGGRGSGPGRGGAGGGGNLQAVCLACPAPEYPRQARRRGWQGVVDLRLQLDAAGHVTAVKVARASGFAVLDQAAIAAARRSRFRISTRSRHATSVWGLMRYRFELGEG